MSHWPQPALMPSHQATVSSHSSGAVKCTVGPSTAPFSGSAFNVNRIYAYPFRIGRPMTIRTAFWMNGATVTGNLQMALYGTSPAFPSDGQEVKLAETGSTAQSGVNTIQTLSIGPITIPPGMYWCAMQGDAATTMFRVSTSPFNAEEVRHMGFYRKDEASFALPSSLATPLSVDFIIPVFGLATQTVI